MLVFGGSLGARALNELAVEAWGERGPAVLHLCGERDYDGAARARVSAPTTALLPVHRPTSVPRLGAPTSSLARAGGSRLGARGGRAAGDPRAVPVRDRATTRRRTPSYFARAGGALVVPEPEAGERVPELVADAARRPGPPGDRMAAAMRGRCEARRGRGDRR